MKEHLFVGSDGDLYDTRNPSWSKSSPLRSKFKWHFGRIESVAQFKSVLRAGAYAWPGGYALELITSDGAALCFSCGRSEARNIFDAIANKDHSGWRVVACDMVDNEEGEETCCDHCSKPIG